jgi:hypothetical protein
MEKHCQASGIESVDWDEEWASVDDNGDDRNQQLLLHADEIQ